MNKVYKKGTKVRLWCCTNSMYEEIEDIVTLDNDMDERRLDDMATEFKEDELGPSWGYEILSEAEDENDEN